ncbi:MAG TPA: hypothetical protein GX701_00380 [Clostridiales bacterium]|nr:hypothetical protein [Clostridiales bacterium]
MKKEKSYGWRAGLVGIAAILLSATMTVQLIRLQHTYKPVASGGIFGVKTSTYTYPLTAARGEIYDRYNRPLVVNKEELVLRLDYGRLARSGDQNGVLLRLTKLLEEQNIAWPDTLPLGKDGLYYTEEWSEEKKNARLTNFLRRQKWDEDLTAEKLFEKMQKLYKIDSSLSYADARTVIGLRYEMEMADFSSSAPFTVAEGISKELAAMVAERQTELFGVRTDTVYRRTYATQYAAHILGRLGVIFQGEYEELKAQGYKMNDLVGKDGAEKAFESYLRGQDGYEKYAVDSRGRVVSELETVAPVGGSHVNLTLDIRLQEAAEKALEKQILSMRAEAELDPTKPQDVEGGAAVVVDVNTGDILAMATYPTYDITRFNELYNTLLEDPLKPMFNRALSGIYSPGSIFKMVTAVAGLETGVITPQTVIPCTGIYRYYPDFPMACWIYTAARITHGDENVIDALRDSCNVFFYDVGRQVSIDTLSRYARMFGLGEKTGVELPGESKGYVAGPESKAIFEKLAWFGGDTLQAAIGQSYNMFTPLQMANYIAALANGGSRYESHLMKYVRSYDYSSVTAASQAFVAQRIPMSEKTHATVMEGMLEVTENGTASKVFKDYPIHVGGKTGSVQVSKGTANSVFAAFAPYDNPEIAVVVVVEHGGSGNAVAPVARDIFDVYFYDALQLPGLPAEGTLIE